MPFNPAVNYVVGNGPRSVAVSDFNRDGKPDLAVANAFSNNVSILLGMGDGTFNAAVNYGTGTYPLSVAAGDFNRDGNPDLAVANWSSDNVSVLLGVGNGTFNPAVTYAVGTGPTCLAVGDFNRDGNPDLAVTNQTSNNVSILLGTGTGTFITSANYATGAIPIYAAVGDFNRDGNPDLAVANGASDNISILLGVGNGTFNAAVNYAIGINPTSVAVGDFNRDGKPDLAIPFLDNNIAILFGNGDGTFNPPVNYITGTCPASVTVGDFNLDGITDLATVNRDSNNASILLGRGDGTFNPAVNLATGETPFFVVAGDFNSDDYPDLAVARGSNSVSILLNTSPPLDLSFGTAVNYGTGVCPEHVATGDFNRDGKADLVVANAAFDNVSVLLGLGDGTFNPAVNYKTGHAPICSAVGDFNRDGKPDLAVANGNSDNVSILLGNGDGTFGAAVNYATDDGPSFVAVGDFNRDGKPDLAVSNVVSALPSGTVSIFLGAGDGTFNAAVNYSAGNHPFCVAIGDFNRDGKPDLAVTNSSSDNVSVLLGNGDGTFNAAINYNVGNNPKRIALGDFNRDGKCDLAVANTGVSMNVSILLGNGDGTFNPAVNYGTVNDPYGLVVGDFNQDGKPDLATANRGGNNVSILLGAGDGAFNAPISYGTWPITYSVAIDDFNRDSKPDLAVCNWGAPSNVSILLNTSSPPPTIVSAVTNATGSVISIAFTKKMADPAGKHGQFTYRVNGDTAQNFSLATLSADNLSINLTCAGTVIAFANTVTVSYTKGTVLSAEGGILASFADQPVTNNVPQSIQQVPPSTGGGMATFATGAGSISNLATVAENTLPATGKPTGVSFPYGLFSFNINSIVPGSTVIVTITLPSALPAGSQYWKFQNNAWVNMTPYLGSNDGDNVITLTLKDGGPGDSDGVANGIIVDPGGPGALRAATSSHKLPSAPASHSSTASVAPPSQPVALSNIQVQNATLSTSKVTPGESVTVNATALNKGTANGSASIKVYINGEVDASQGVTVASGKSMPLAFTVSRNEPGAYRVYVNNVPAGSFTVEAVRASDILLYASLACILSSLVLALVYVRRPRSRASD